jgi:hypothetical protein
MPARLGRLAHFMSFSWFCHGVVIFHFYNGTSITRGARCCFSARGVAAQESGLREDEALIEIVYGNNLYEQKIERTGMEKGSALIIMLSFNTVRLRHVAYMRQFSPDSTKLACLICS